MTDIAPFPGNPILIKRTGSEIEVRMLPSNGGQAGDYQSWKLSNIGPYVSGDANSFSWGITGIGSVLGAIPTPILDFGTGIKSTLESAVYVSDSPTGAQVDTGIWHGKLRRLSAYGYVNGSGPEIFANLTQDWLPCSSFYIEQNFECRLPNGYLWGTYTVQHNFGYHGGTFPKLLVEQFWTPTASIYIRTLYGMMACATGMNRVNPVGLPVITCTKNDDSIVPDFGQTIREFQFYNTARPSVMLKAKLPWDGLQGRPPAQGTNANLQNGFGHLQDQKDGVDKIRSLHTSFVTPVLWTQPVHLLSQYEVGLY
jgi:hypothetical protein